MPHFNDLDLDDYDFRQGWADGAITWNDLFAEPESLDDDTD